MSASRMLSAPEISCTALGFRSVGVRSAAVRTALGSLAFICGFLLSYRSEIGKVGGLHCFKHGRLR